ncbi:META domain-containing protein [Weeksellaceae bacterium TAE3-ERU29]|nr:META domain-containing protein [Weeksellaceae bacterium TAE3-ERU29]
MKKLIVLLIISITFFSCDSLKPVGKVSTDENKLVNNWVLQNDKSIEYGLNSEPLSINFSKSAEENKISGFAGCNKFFGNYSAFNGKLIISNIGATKMACPQLDAEGQYLSLLGKANRYEIKGNNLFLYNNNLLLLHFEAK